VRAGHDERPRRQVPEADPHPDPARVLAPDQLVHSEEDERSGSGVLEQGQREYDLRGKDYRHHEADGGGVSKGDGPESLENRLSASF
jgi:hypothetical protein